MNKETTPPPCTGNLRTWRKATRENAGDSPFQAPLLLGWPQDQGHSAGQCRGTLSTFTPGGKKSLAEHSFQAGLRLHRLQLALPETELVTPHIQNRPGAGEQMSPFLAVLLVPCDVAFPSP